MQPFKKIVAEFSHHEQVLNITLKAPKGNVLDMAMMSEITQSIDEMAQVDSVKVIVFRADGDHFSFGASVREHEKELVPEMLRTFHALMRNLIATSKPTVALVQGCCLGGGLELAAFCHWIFAYEDATFGQPEIKLGVFPPVASLVLPFRMGQSAADDLILTGESISALRAQEVGLVHSVSAEAEQEMDAFILKHLLSKSSVALQYAVKSARYGMNRAFLSHLDGVEEIYIQELMNTRDANEGISAFIEKRSPTWENR